MGMPSLIVAVLLAAAAPSTGGFLTGQMLKQYLDDAEAGSSFAERTIAMGYIAGVSDLSSGRTVCLRRPLTSTEAMQSVHRWLRAHSDRLNENAADLVRGALSEAHACEGNSQAPGAASR